MKHEITSNNTKKMLAETLESLLHQKPISKITVSEIVNICQINRKTFYYHFPDVYALLEWHLEQEANAAMLIVKPFAINKCINFAMDYLEQNKYLQNCTCNSIGRDTIVQFLNRKLLPASIEMIENWEKQYEKTLDEDLKNFLAKMLTNVIVLSLVDVINNGTTLKREDLLMYLSDIFHNSVEGFFQKI